MFLGTSEIEFARPKGAKDRGQRKKRGMGTNVAKAAVGVAAGAAALKNRKALGKLAKKGAAKVGETRGAVGGKIAKAGTKRKIAGLQAQRKGGAISQVNSSLAGYAAGKNDNLRVGATKRANMGDKMVVSGKKREKQGDALRKIGSAIRGQN